MNESVDTSSEMGYNEAKLYDDYEAVVKMDEQRPLNDPDCEHFLVEDPTDILDGHTAWVCSGCGLGTFCPPGLNPNTAK